MTDALLPASPDAEQALLSSFLLDPKFTGRLCAERRVATEHFHIPAHATIFGAVLGMWAAERPVDIVTLTQILRDRNELDRVGGASYVTDLFVLMPTAANAAFYIDILQEKLTLRRIIEVCQKAGHRSFSEQDNLHEILAEVQSRIAGIGLGGSAKTPTMRENIFEAVEALEGRMTGGASVITTGLAALDDDLGPIERGNLLVIAGQTKSGKSLLAGQIALNLALAGKPVLFISLEMTRRELTLRFLSTLARVNTRMVRLWSEADHQRFNAAQSTLTAAAISIETGHHRLAEIMGLCQQHAARAGEPLACIVLDYAQLCEGMRTGREDRRQQEIAEISRGCKRLAGSLNVLFILLTQLNDDGRTREGRDLENDANLMIEVGHNRDTGDRGAKVVLARSAPSGQRLKLRIIAEHTRVEDDPDMDIDTPQEAPKKKRNWHKE